MREDGGIAGQVFRDLGLEIERVQTVIERMTGLGQYSSSRPELSPGTQKVLEIAVEEARKLGHHYIGVEHLLLGLASYNDGVAIAALAKLGVTPEQIKRQTQRVLKENKQPQRRSTPAQRPQKREKKEKIQDPDGGPVGH